ncbi:MAG: NAD-dependent epimerase/dehydratase family protein, partial [Deltaproteobacteria bacterium]|nr:NAD-dependent epimerase/dehydratase family protein [Deltaproteobacteria bacterium]
MRVLVTGGAGFIGSHLVDAFVARGYEVTALDDLSSGRAENLPAGARLARLDIRAPEVGALMDEIRPELLVHHAAQMDVRKSVADPGFDADVNVVGTLRLLEHCRRVGTTRVLFASTGGAIYGDQEQYPASESHPTRPLSPYGVAKLSVEHYLHYYAVQFGLRTTCLRYANVYGPRQNAEGEAGVVAIFSRKLLAGAAGTIYGTGEQTRDFVFVGDVVRANLAALERDLTGAYNVGTGVETSVNALYDGVCRAVGRELAPLSAPGKLGEQLRSCLDAGALRRAAGWSPATSLDAGLAATV